MHYDMRVMLLTYVRQLVTNNTFHPPFFFHHLSDSTLIFHTVFSLVVDQGKPNHRDDLTS